MANENLEVSVGANIANFRAGMATVVQVSRSASSAIASGMAGSAASIGRAFTSMGSSIIHTLNLLGAHIFSIRSALAGLVTGFAVQRFISSFISAGAQMENFKVQIRATFGGFNQLADEALDRIVEFARVTPFTTQEVIEGFSLMQAAGLEVNDKVLDAIGNTAFVFNRSFSDVSTAMISMETEVLRRLGVILDRTGDKAIIMSRGIRREVNNTRDAIFAGLIEVLGKNFAGAMKNAEDTWRGAMANLMSLWEEFQLTFGAQITGILIPRIKDFINLWTDLQSSGVINRLGGLVTAMVTGIVGKLFDLGEATVKYFANNEDAIYDFINKIVNGFLSFKDKTIEAFNAVKNTIIELKDSMKELVELMKKALSLSTYIPGPIAKMFGLIKPEPAELLGILEGDLEQRLKDLAFTTRNSLGLTFDQLNQLSAESLRVLAGYIQDSNQYVEKAQKDAMLKAAGVKDQIESLHKTISELAPEGGPVKVPPEIAKANGEAVAQAVAKAAAQYKLDPNYLAALIMKESKFVPGALGTKGEIGLGQIKPATGTQFKTGDITEPIENVFASAKITADLVNKFVEAGASLDDALQLAAAAYNAGTSMTMDEVQAVMNSNEGVQRYVAARNALWKKFSSGEMSIMAEATRGAGVGGTTATAAAVRQPWDIRKLANVELTEELKKQAEIMEVIKYIESDVEATTKSRADWESAVDNLLSEGTSSLKKQRESYHDSYIKTQLQVAELEYGKGIAGDMTAEVEKQKFLNSEDVKTLVEKARTLGVESELYEKILKPVLAMVDANRELEKVVARKTFLKNISDEIEDLQLELQAARAITVEEQARVEVQKELLDAKRKGIDLTAADKALMEAQIEQRTRLNRELERTKQLGEDLIGALQQMGSAIQQGFSDLWYNLFTGGTKGFKDFLRNIADSLLKAVSNFMGTLMTATLKGIVEGLTGHTIEDMTKKISQSVSQGLQDWLKAVGLGLPGQVSAGGAPAAQGAIPDLNATGVTFSTAATTLQTAAATSQTAAATSQTAAASNQGAAANFSTGASTFGLAVEGFKAAVANIAKCVCGGGGGSPAAPGSPMPLTGGGGTLTGDRGDWLWAVNEDFSKVGEGAQDLSQEIKDEIAKGFEGGATEAESTMGGLFTSIIDGFKSVGRWIASIFTSVFDWVKTSLSGLLTGTGTGGFSFGGLGLGGGSGGIFGAGGLFSGLTGGGWGAAPAGVEGPLMSGGGFFSQAGGWLSSLFSFFHEGGVVGKTFAPVKAVDPRVFYNAPRMHRGNLRSNERPVILEEGETVLPKSMTQRNLKMSSLASSPYMMSGGGVGYMPSQPSPVDLTVILNNPIDPRVMKSTPQEIVRAVTRSSRGDGDVRSMIVKEIGRKVK